MRNRPQVVVLLVLTVTSAIHMAYFVPQMPEPIATHFGGGGRPNGWMSHTGFVVFEVLVVGFVMLVMLGAAAFIRVLPARLINVPNRDYWFAPERHRASSALLFGQMMWLVCGVFAFFIALNHLVFTANLAPNGPRLSEMNLVWMLVATVMCLGVWIWRLLVLFGSPPSGGTQ